METKKTPKANLESRKPTWLLVGYIVVLAFMFIAIEWTRDIKIDTSGGIADDIFELDIEMPITRQPELAPPPPPQVTPINDVLTIVDDASSVEETTIQTTEDFGEAVDIKYVPVVTEEDVPAEDEIFEVVEEKPDFADGGQSEIFCCGHRGGYGRPCSRTVCCKQGWKHCRREGGEGYRPLSGQGSYSRNLFHAEVETG